MNIQQRRLDKGWSQEQLARHSGLSTRTIQRIESGQRVGLESQKCLAAVFETSISVLTHEQAITEQKNEEQSKQLKINKTEQEAIKFAKSMFKGSKKGKADPLWKIEREAIDYAKRLLNKFKT
jgi:transcriptional regulator with XRE-family HTH domain